MDLIKAKTILSRLNAMHQSLEGSAHLSTLERDLILNYLRELYQIYHEAEVNTIPEVRPATVLPVEKSAEKDSIQKTLEFKFEPEPKTEPILTLPIPDLTPVDEPVINIYEPILREEPKQSVVTEPIKIPEPEILPEVKSPVVPPISHSIPVSISELFVIKKGSELSDKLNELPLKDINRAIGLNDKLEIIGNLFGGQKSIFDTIINDLNNLKSFDEAHNLLGAGPAIQFKWDHEDRKEKAIDFIKLIRRRYL